MDYSSSTFFNYNTASLNDYWIKKKFPEYPPALQSTTPLDTPPDWHSPSHFPSPAALNKIYADEFSHEYISRKSHPTLEPSDYYNSLEKFESNSSISVFIKDSVSLLVFDISSSLNSLPDSLVAPKYSSLKPAFHSGLDSSATHIKIECPTSFQHSSPKFSLDSEFKFLGSIELEKTPMNLMNCTIPPSIFHLQLLPIKQILMNSKSSFLPPQPSKFTLRHLLPLRNSIPNL
ncbi:hypothetical protein O181_004948 [Austropuccinia psidii MF-1]|uniref:Uncharacterized protein n=1 Tax=Austropuccinia psidii MF-1 TaxID=1389203 RepID=A0A9Q3GF26_9BASI|nr:hypothetical protein [Austropuccinia psidii MF-1]